MTIRVSKSAAILALGVTFLLTPALLLSTSLILVDSAFAAKGGNGNGNSGGNGNGNGNGSSSAKSEKSSPAKAEKAAKSVEVASTEKKAKIKVKVNIASKLGALNAAHASANSLAKANPNSRVGKIAAYRDANATSEVAAAAATEAATKAATALETAAAALSDWEQAVIAASNPALAKAVIDAQLAVDNGTPLDPALAKSLLDAQAAVTAANELVTSTLATKDETALLSEAAATKAAAAVTAAAEAEALALEALNAAANKPVDQDVRDAVDQLLAGK